MIPPTIDVNTRAGLEAVLDVTRAAAREAGLLVLTGFRRSLIVGHKGAVDLVTKFDTESETLVRQRLGKAFPVPIIGEEQGGHIAGSDAVFYVDPLDGTTNFVHGHPFWCVSIGLVVRGRPVLGVVLAPLLGMEWFGWMSASGERRTVRRFAHNALMLPEGRAAEHAAEPPLEEECVVSDTSTLEESLIATGFPADRRTNPDNNFDAFIAVKTECRGIRRCGSAALDLCFVADGTYDGYWEKRLKPWDVAGGAAIVHAAGGQVTDYDGGSTFLDSGNLVATNARIHDPLITILTDVAKRSTHPTSTAQSAPPSSGVTQPKGH